MNKRVIKNQKMGVAAPIKDSIISDDEPKNELIIPNFEYKKSGEKNKTKYLSKKFIIPDQSGGIMRIYLEKNGTISAIDGLEHELILAEVEIPYDELEPIDPLKPTKGTKKKAKIFKPRYFEIPNRP